MLGLSLSKANPLECGAPAPLSVSQQEQPTFNLCHPFNARNGFWLGNHRRIKLVAQQMLDVVNQQLLMLHLVLEPEPNDRNNLFRIVSRIQKLDTSARRYARDSDCGFDSRTRAGAALRPFNARAKTFVVRIEVEEKLV